MDSTPVDETVRRNGFHHNGETQALEAPPNGTNGVSTTSVQPPPGFQRLPDFEFVARIRPHSWVSDPNADGFEFVARQATCDDSSCFYTQDQIEQGQSPNARTHQSSAVRPRLRWAPYVNGNGTNGHTHAPVYQYHSEQRFVRHLWFDPLYISFHTTGNSRSPYLCTRFIIISPNQMPVEDGSDKFCFVFEAVALVGQRHLHIWAMIRLPQDIAGPLLSLVMQCSIDRIRLGITRAEQQLVHHFATMDLRDFDGQAICEEIEERMNGPLQLPLRPTGASPANQSTWRISAIERIEIRTLLNQTQRFHVPTGTYSTFFGRIIFGLPPMPTQPSTPAKSFADKSPPIPKIPRRFCPAPSLRKAVVDFQAHRRLQSQ